MKNKYSKLSNDLKILHRKAADHYSRMNTVINIFNITLVSAISIVNNVSAVSGYQNVILQVGYSGLLYLSALISTIQQFFKFDELAEKHRTASTRYNHLYNVIQMPENIISNIIEEYENIYNNSPPLPEHGDKPILDDTVQDGINFSQVDAATAFQLNRLILQSYNST